MIQLAVLKYINKRFKIH